MKKNLAVDSRRSPCDESNSQNMERLAYTWIARKIGCNLPWSNIKISTVHACCL